MTWIKICGTTNLEDALTAVDAGADALGFVFYENSPSNVDPETVRQIVAHLPETRRKSRRVRGSPAELCTNRLPKVAALPQYSYTPPRMAGFR